MPEEAVRGQRIDSWKDIAAYLGRDIRTVIRWEKDRGLPVRRVPGGQRQAVFAFRHELDAWLAGPRQFQSDAAQVGIFVSPIGAAVPVGIAQEKLESRIVKNIPPLSRFLFWMRFGLIAIASIVALGWAAYRRVGAHLLLSAPEILSHEILLENNLEKIGLITDGKSLYFGQEENGRFALASMDVQGGPVRILWRPDANVRPIDFSPDGKTILALAAVGVVEDQPLWLIPVDGSPAQRLGSVVAHSASWSPDGHCIAFASGMSLFLVNPNGSGLRTVSNLSAVADALHWSDDGLQLRFLLQDIVRRNVTYWELGFAEGMKTSVLRSLTSSADLDRNWTSGPGPDQSLVPGMKLGNTPLWLIAHGRRWWEPAIQMTAIHLGWQTPPFIAFDRQTHRLFALTDSASQRRFVRFDFAKLGFRSILPGVNGIYLDYSRDARWVTYVSTDQNLWYSRTDGTAAQQITFPPETVELPRWSPDGREIAFSVKTRSGLWRIHIFDLRTGQIREASEGSDHQGAPTWSPDGRFLAYGNVHCEWTSSCAVHRVDLANGKVQTLPGSEGLWTARWSPDGHAIAALQPQQHQLYVFRVKDRRWKKLMDGLEGTDLEWSSDSQFLYTNIPGADARISRIHVADGKEETILNLRSEERFDLADTAADLGFSIGPENSLILHRPSHSTEIHVYELQSE